ncbi:MAG: GTP cyclohydrolase II [Deltaproteobacteria bacterium]|nr:GTP cyclohydrolase II [Deltaproteobacteria bacterium]
MALPITSGKLTVHAETRLPTQHGMFRMVVFTYDGESGEHVAMIKGDLRGAVGLPVRVHSECLTSEVFGSLKCDCREQLQSALASIERAGRGMVIYLRQEGRGIGLINKVRAYALQEKGADTIEANERLGLPVEGRSYDAAAAMLEHLGVKSVKLLTNNPDKLEKLTALGVKVVGRLPVVVPANPYSARYLAVKRERMAHLLADNDDGHAELPNAPRLRVANT